MFEKKEEKRVETAIYDLFSSSSKLQSHCKCLKPLAPLMLWAKFTVAKT